MQFSVIDYDVGCVDQTHRLFSLPVARTKTSDPRATNIVEHDRRTRVRLIDVEVEVAEPEILHVPTVESIRRKIAAEHARTWINIERLRHGVQAGIYRATADEVEPAVAHGDPSNRMAGNTGNRATDPSEVLRIVAGYASDSSSDDIAEKYVSQCPNRWFLAFALERAPTTIEAHENRRSLYVVHYYVRNDDVLADATVDFGYADTGRSGIVDCTV